MLNYLTMQEYFSNVRWYYAEHSTVKVKEQVSKYNYDVCADAGF